MKILVRISFLSLIVFIISLFITNPALAIPPLPSSFYGTVKVNQANVADGTIIQALVGGQVVAEGFTQIYQGESVYALDVRGDDPDTAIQDGGREGDVIQFKIGGAAADQTGVWHGGTNANLNLTASATVPIITPQATPSPVPTQTDIILIQPSPTPTTIGQASPTPTGLIPSSPTATSPTQPAPISTTQVQPSPNLIPAETENGSGTITRVVVVILAILAAVVIGYTFWKLPRKKK
jgi:hypothetical protein